MSYHFVVLGPTRYMNHGHRPEYFRGRIPRHPMIANVEMSSEKMLKIDDRYRPVFEFKTVRPAKKGVELFYDYGVHDDEIYYEVLRRKNAVDSPHQRQEFLKILQKIENDRYRDWRADFRDRFDDDGDNYRDAFYCTLLIQFLNTPDTVLYPGRL